MSYETDPTERDEEAQAEAAEADIAERVPEFDGASHPHPDYAPPGTSAGGPAPRIESGSLDEAAMEVAFEDLDDEQKVQALYEAVGFLLQKTQQLEQSQLVLGKTLYRVLVKAGEIDEDALEREGGIVIPSSDIVVPGKGRMDVPK